jgi:hypothetical protein
MTQGTALRKQEKQEKRRETRGLDTPEARG